MNQFSEFITMYVIYFYYLHTSNEYHLNYEMVKSYYSVNSYLHKESLKHFFLLHKKYTGSVIKML